MPTNTVKIPATFAAVATLAFCGVAWYMNKRFPLTNPIDETGHLVKIVIVASVIGILAGLTAAAWHNDWLHKHSQESPFEKVARLVKEGKIIKTAPTRSGWFDYTDQEGNFLFGCSQAPPRWVLKKY